MGRADLKHAMGLSQAAITGEYPPTHLIQCFDRLHNIDLAVSFIVTLNPGLRLTGASKVSLQKSFATHLSGHAPVNPVLSDKFPDVVWTNDTCLEDA